MNLQELADREAAALRELLAKKWAVGVQDRGMGHYSYAVIVEDTQSGPPIVECSSLELAQHIVDLHNKDK